MEGIRYGCGSSTAILYAFYFGEKMDHKLAAKWISESDALVFSAGAGMGVDSGLPDFRGTDGFWKAYPPLKHLNIDFASAACPEFFESNYKMAWGFYGHRLNLYRNVNPHNGYNILNSLSKDKDHFVVTSNVDGQFQKSGIESKNVYEVHGSIHNYQCLDNCTKDIYQNKFDIDVDHNTCIANISKLKCPKCKGKIRPNILMFGDYRFLTKIVDSQSNLYSSFMKRNKDKKVCIIECGAGTQIPSIRNMSYKMVKDNPNFNLIRINVRDYQIDSCENTKALGFSEGAKSCLEKIYSLL